MSASHEHHGSYLEPKGGFWATVWDWATTVDHKKIGVMYLFAILFMFFLGGVAAMAVRLELFFPVRMVVEHTASGDVTHLVGQLFASSDSTSLAKGNDIYNKLF